MPAPLIQVEDLTKRFGATVALDGAKLTILPGEVHALCGENGAGKSTLIGVLAGVWPSGSYKGEVRIEGRPVQFRSVRDAQAAGIVVLYQEFALVPNLSIAENLFLGQERSRRGWLLRREMEAEAAEWLRRLGVERDPRTPVGELGVGERQMVEIARALRQRARLLILDEPTAALTEAETQRLFHLLQRLRKQGVALLYVSHRLDEVFRLADRITILRDGRTVGTWPVGEITETEVIRAMVGGTVEAYYARDESVLRRSGEPLLSVEGWTLWTPSGRRRIENVSFEVRAGEVLGIGGVVGAGRSELLLSLFGAWTGRREGRLRWKGQEVQIRNPQEALQRGIALVPEDRKRQGLMPDASILDNLALPNLEQYSPGGWIRWERAVAAAQRAIEQLRIRTAALTAPARHLSGGNQQKLVLGKWLPRRPRLLLLDEPTRGIDVGAKAEIHAWIAQRARQEGIAVLLTSSDLAELIALSDRLVVLHEGRIVGRFETTQGLTPAEVLACATGGTAR